MKFTKRFVSSIALLLAITTVFTDVSTAYADDLSANETTEFIYDADYLSAKALGSDGIAYDATYVSNQAFLSLNEDAQEAYVSFCDDIAEMNALGYPLEDVVLATDSEGNVHYSFSVSEKALTASINDLTKDILSNEEVLPFEAIDISQNDISENDISLNDVSQNDISENDISSNEEELPSEDIPADISENDISANEETEIPSDSEEEMVYYEENMSLLNLCDDEEIECFDDEPLDGIILEKNTKLDYFDKSYFSKQLTGNQVNVYKAFSKGCKSTASISTNTYLAGADACRGISCLFLVYPNNYNFRATDKGFSGYYSYNSRARKYTFKLSIAKSKYYKSSTQTAASKKAAQLVKEAYDYSAAHYASKGYTTYGIIEYLDKWVCENNYYNNDGTITSMVKTEVYYNCHRAYGILLKGYGVCESYAMAMSWMLDKAGITNIYAVSDDHAYVYVLMPNNSWYMLDSTWNDSGSGSSKQYLLSGADSNAHHKSTGQFFNSGAKFNFPSLASSKYSATAESMTLPSLTVLKKGASKVVALSNTYYKDFTKKWTSSDTKVATVNGSGKVSTKKSGTTNVSVTIAGRTATTKVVAYELGNVNFTANNKNRATITYLNADTSWTNDSDTIELVVTQKNKVLTAEQLVANSSLVAPTLSMKQKDRAVADITLASFSGDTIKLKVTPHKVGKVTATVNFNGKKATVTYVVKQKLQASWFDTSAVAASYDYTGKAIKPVITAKDTIPAKNIYTLKYKANVNAGTATVYVEGKGSYGGTVEKTFKINPIDVNANCKLSFKKIKNNTTVYNFKSQVPGVTVKYGKTKLKAGRDYNVLYNGKSDLPVKVGTYKVTVVGTGNFKNTFTETYTYTITKLDAKKLKLSCKSSIKASKKGLAVSPAPSVSLGKYKINNTTTPTYTVTYYDAGGAVVKAENLVNPGKYKVRVTFTDKTDLDTTNAQYLEKSFTIKK